MTFKRLLAIVATLLSASCGSTSKDSSDSATGGTSSGGSSAAAGRGGSHGQTNGGSGGNGGNPGGAGGNFDAAGSGGTAGGDVAQGGEGGAEAVTLGCAGWELHTLAGNPSTATVVDGALLIERPAYPEAPIQGFYNNTDVMVTQAGLSGDFEITVEWQDFQPAGAEQSVGPRAEAGVWWDGVPNVSPTAQASATVGDGDARAAIIHGDQFTTNGLDPSPSPESLVGASGTFHITRSGSSFIVESTVNGQTASAASEEPFSEEPLTLFLAIGKAGFGADPEDGSITITNVTVVGGGGQVKSDDFSCP